MAYINHKAEESLEDYLETIMILSKENRNLHAIDIARHLDYSKPSVSIALKNMKVKGLVEVSEDGIVSLTEEGEKWAVKVYERHKLLTEWLEYLGVPHDIANDDACKMEHDITEQSFEAIKKCILQIMK